MKEKAGKLPVSNDRWAGCLARYRILGELTNEFRRFLVAAFPGVRPRNQAIQLHISHTLSY